MMKKTVCLLLAVILLFACACSAGGSGSSSKEDTSLTDIQAKGKLVIGLDDNFPPAGYRDDSGELVGFDIDFARAVCEKLGVEADFQPTEWAGVVLSLKNGDIDCIWNALSMTEERQKEIAFSRCYAVANNVIIVAKGSDIKDKAGLSGKIVGVQLSSSGQDAVEADPIYEELKELKKYGTYTEAFMDLTIGRVEAIVTDKVNAEYYLSLEGMSDNVTIIETGEDSFAVDRYGVGLRKEDAALKEAIDKAMEELKEDGTIQALNDKWFGGAEVIV